MASRFYHTNVQDRRGEILANALMQTFADVRQSRRQSKLDAEREEERGRARAMQDFTLGQQHVRLTKPGEVPAELSNIANTINVAPGLAATQPDWGAIAQGRPQTLVEGTNQLLVQPRTSPALRFGDGWVQDVAAVEADRTRETERAREAALADALFKASVQDRVNPGARQADVDYKKALAAQARAQAAAAQQRTEAPVRMEDVTLGEGVFAWNPVTGQRGPRLGSAPVPASVQRAQMGTTAQGQSPVARPRHLTDAQWNKFTGEAQTLQNLRQSLEAVQQHVRQFGTSHVGTERAMLDGLLADAQIAYKEAAKLGVLAGPDMELIQNAIGNPTSLTQWARGGKDGVLATLTGAQRSLDRKARTMTQTYGAPIQGWEYMPDPNAPQSAVPMPSPEEYLRSLRQQGRR